jgi:hypothetical protein
MEVVSAEDIQAKFMEAFRFDEMDLATNREGELSPKQLHQMRRHAIVTFVISSLVVPLVVFLFIFPNFRNEMKTPGLVLVGFISFPCILIGSMSAWLYWQAYKSGTVICLHGTVDFRQDGYKVLMSIDEESILVQANVRELFEPNAIYNVYYVVYMPHIMSIEKVE